MPNPLSGPPGAFLVSAGSKRKLSLPVGLFAVHDYRALIVLSACRDIGLREPDDVAVVGADNNLMVCEFSVPPLSTVCINSHRMGQDAAKLLDRMMQGEAPPQGPILVDPPRSGGKEIHRCASSG